MTANCYKYLDILDEFRKLKELKEKFVNEISEILDN
jgi:hypothetical protein